VSLKAYSAVQRVYFALSVKNYAEMVKITQSAVGDTVSSI
jgi:hypothetical protein